MITVHPQNALSHYCHSLQEADRNCQLVSHDKNPVLIPRTVHLKRCMLLCINYISIALIQSKIQRDVKVGDRAGDHGDSDQEK